MAMTMRLHGMQATVRWTFWGGWMGLSPQGTHPRAVELVPVGAGMARRGTAHGVVPTTLPRSPLVNPPSIITSP
jgi:hypothetical protein